MIVYYQYQCKAFIFSYYDFSLSLLKFTIKLKKQEDF
jgi:hypothetical protein